MSYMKSFEDPMYDEDGVMVDEDGPMIEDEVMDLISLYGTDSEAIQMIADQLAIPVSEVESIVISLGFTITEDLDEPYEPDFEYDEL